VLREQLKRLSYKSGPAFSLLREWRQLFDAWLMKVHEDDYFLLPKSINGRTIADIGANTGQSIISFRKIFPDSPICSFEPNPKCLKTLRKVSRIVGGKVEIFMCGVGNSNSSIDYFVPVIEHDVEFFQEGSFDIGVFSQEVTRNRIGKTFRLNKTSVNTVRLDDLSLSSSLIKIDVQGFEYEVLLGSMRLLQKDHPVVIVEADEVNNARIAELMKGLGYRRIEGRMNTIYVHADKERSS